MDNQTNQITTSQSVTAEDKNIFGDINLDSMFDEDFLGSSTFGDNVQKYDKDGLLIDQEPRWYTCQVNVNNEEAAKKILEQKIQNLGLEEKVLEVYVPMKKVYKLNKEGQRVEKLEKVHPGYLYINAILTKQIAYEVQSLNMITRIPTTGGVYAPLAEGFVQKIKENITEEEQSDTKKIQTSISLGDTVKVVNGHFNNMDGKVCGLDVDNARVSVLLNIFDRETVVDLDLLEVAKNI
jgi:transcription termination/antitermination protein NusG